MRLLIHFFTTLGVIAFLLLGVVGYQVQTQYQRFYPEAFGVYWRFAHVLLKTGSPAQASAWKVKVEDDVSLEDVEEAIKAVANEHNIKLVAELPLYKQVEAMQGKPSRFVKIFMFCDALTAAKILSYDDAFSANLPCGITLIEDKVGQYWLYAMNMDMMIYGGAALPEALKVDVIKIKEMVLDIMRRGAAGDF